MAGPTAPTEVPRRAVRGGYAKGDARRELIIEVATEIFGTQGFRAATMLQIAAACGISRTGLLHHFPTKESLLEAVLAHRDTGGQETGRHEIGGTPATPDGEDLARHAAADHGAIELAVDSREVRMTVTDDGVGIAPETSESGLRNARRRAAALGGSLELAPRQPRGTSFVWRVPLR